MATHANLVCCFSVRFSGFFHNAYRAPFSALAWCVALVASQALAADWPADSKNWFDRGPGGGVSILLVSLWWLWVPLWAGCCSWVAKDMGRWNLSKVVWPMAWGLG